jgi:hypothetical protein
MFSGRNSASGGPTQLINKSAEAVLIFNEDLRGVIISFIELKFRSHSLVDITNVFVSRPEHLLFLLPI